MTVPLYGLVLAGGESRRMGRDKAGLFYAGRPQLERAFGLLAPRVAPCFVSLRADQADDPVRRGWPGIVDRLEGIGPAAGLLAAHEAYPEVAWLVLACDLPLLDGASLDALIQARGEGRVAVAFRSEHDGAPEPLCAVWEPVALDRLRCRVAEGGGSLRRVLGGAGVCLLAPRTSGALDNVNTPAERERAEVLLAGMRNAEGQEQRCHR